MRLEGRMRLGYYPLDQREAQRMRRFLQFPNEPASALDPCAGTGTALGTITESSASRLYGIELDSHRALEARKTLDEVIQGNAFDAKAPVESFSLLYLNPPYDFEVGEGKNQRMEKLFLEEFFRWLKPGGVLAMVIPFDRIYECRNVLSPHFKDKAIYRLTEPEAERYKQAAVFGVRRSAVSQALFETTLGADGQARRTILYDGSPEFVLHRLAVRFGLPALPEWAEWFRADLDRRGLVEDLLGFNCSPVVIKGTKLRMLRILSTGLKRKLIAVPPEVSGSILPLDAARSCLIKLRAS